MRQLFTFQVQQGGRRHCVEAAHTSTTNLWLHSGASSYLPLFPSSSVLP